MIRFIRSRVALVGFILIAAWTTITAMNMNRVYQDAWILDGIWIPLATLFIIYLFNVSFSSNLQRVSALTAAITFLLYIVPALKYAVNYSSSVDSVVHTSLMRTIALTGQVEPSSSYAGTPGFHTLVAALSQISGISITFWAKMVSGLLGGIVPLAVYMLCRRSSLPVSLAKIIIIFSGLGLPLLYSLNGTTFTTPMFVLMLAILFLREVDQSQPGHKVSYTVLLLLYTSAIVFWHPSTSLIVPILIISLGMLAALDHGKKLFLEHSKKFTSLGVLGMTTVFSYWMYDADFVWSHFVKNISLALQPDITPDLIPARLFEITLKEQVLIALFYHARDGVLIFLGILGLIFLLSRAGQSAPFARFIRTFGLMWLICFFPMLAILGTGLGAQGYKRFLFYVVAASPMLAGYGLWKGLQILRESVPWLSENGTVAASLFLTLVIASLQLYPYQPAVPTLAGGGSNRGETAILWLHQVNTSYQYHMLDFAYRNLPSDRQLIADYIGYQQVELFFGRDAKTRFRRTTNQEPQPAFVLLHWPGKAGAFGEQAEFRSLDAITAWRDRQGMSTVYDNGGSFILYYPDNPTNPFSLEK